MINVYKKWRLHRRYKEGKVLSQPIALDVYREILIINSSKVEDGTITGRVRTINRLYVEFGGMEDEIVPFIDLDDGYYLVVDNNDKVYEFSIGEKLNFAKSKILDDFLLDFFIAGVKGL